MVVCLMDLWFSVYMMLVVFFGWEWMNCMSCLCGLILGMMWYWMFGWLKFVMKCFVVLSCSCLVSFLCVVCVVVVVSVMCGIFGNCFFRFFSVR